MYPTKTSKLDQLCVCAWVIYAHFSRILHIFLILLWRCLDECKRFPKKPERMSLYGYCRITVCMSGKWKGSSVCFGSIKRPLMAMKKLGQTICSSSNKGSPSYSFPVPGSPLKVVLLELWIRNPGSKLPVSSGVLFVCTMFVQTHSL